MIIGVFDIETYRDLFCFVLSKFDEHRQPQGTVVVSSHSGKVTAKECAEIEAAFNSCDYIVSYNGNKFDIPVLCAMFGDVDKNGFTTSRYIYTDANQIINFDGNRNYRPLVYKDIPKWHEKHFDILNCCLLEKSLKQWEMYSGLRIEELPYEPDTLLSGAEKQRIIEYCTYDTVATATVFFERCYGRFEVYRELVEMYPKHIPRRLDRPIASMAEGIVYGTRDQIPPKTLDPLDYIEFERFGCPEEVKNIIRKIAREPKPASTAEARLRQLENTFKGVSYGKGGSHFIRKGMWRNIHAFDVASMYPTIIIMWKLLKTLEANEKFKSIREERFRIKHDPAQQTRQKALKDTLNSVSGKFRAQGSTAYDVAVGEAMCYIAQMVISECAFACPELAKLIEVNTDSVFVIGDANIDVLRNKITPKLLKDYGIVLEEEVFDMCYFRDVNNYIIYDKDGNFLDGRGAAYSDFLKKGSNRAVYINLFRNLVRSELELDWSGFTVKDFVVKYHRAASCKYAEIGGEPMQRKNYYFLWTTQDCPGAKPIQFSRTLVDSHNGSVKARFGVYAFDIKDLEKYMPYIDYRQYHKDLDDELELWGRDDLCTTRLTKEYRKSNKAQIKSINDLIKGVF